jgi:predicted phosphoadenosine phosphosulfate sulfurtransferase
MLRQVYQAGENVLDAARRRIRFVFDHYENIIVSVSGGKDSTVLAHLALVEAVSRGRRIGIHFLDEEVVYQSSVEQVDKLMSLFPFATKRMWLQVPFHLTNATSLTDGQLRAWEPGEHKLWMRPKREDAIKARPWSPEQETIRDKTKGFGFYDAIDAFARCHHNTAFLVGLRAAGESPNRWRAVTKNPVMVGGKKVYWGTGREQGNVTLYPIFDWVFGDVWKYIHDERLPYSKIYDLQFKKGYAVTEMRISSFIHERAFKSIVDLPEFEPKTYAKLQKRVKGIALAQETGRSAKLFACRKLPKQYKSWRVYRDFLLETHPRPEHKAIFAARFARHLDNEYVARQQCRQLILGDVENNCGVRSEEDPRDALIAYYEQTL